MPRSKTYSNEQIVERALDHFWKFGFAATSMDVLVSVTKVSRHGIYSAFGGKKALFLACLSAYERAVVTPAFASVEKSQATTSDIADYFHCQIDLAERVGLPGPGCLIANTLTERAPHDPAIMAAVTAHHARLRNGFRNALSNASKQNASNQEGHADVGDLAAFLVMSATGLWSLSRSVCDAAELRRYVETMMFLIEQRIG